MLVMQDSLNSGKSRTKLVDIILPLEQSEDQDAWQKAISKESEIKAKERVLLEELLVPRWTDYAVRKLPVSKLFNA